MAGSTSVGYVSTAARREEGPIIEYSKAQQPNALIASTKDTGKKLGKPSPTVPLYHGGVKYGLAFEDDTAMNLRNGRPQPIGDGLAPDALSGEKATTTKQWDTIQNTPQTTVNGLVSERAGNNISTQSSHYVPHVPAWTETDGGKVNRTHYGQGSDSWASWDGCTPVAASMIIGYHEGIRPENDYRREFVIDHPHVDMNTSSGGWTLWRDVAPGIRRFNEGNKDYDALRVFFSRRSQVTNEIHSNRPVLLNMNNGGSAQGKSKAYDDHSVTVVGYYNRLLRIHDGWDWAAHDFWWGNWGEAEGTYVYPS